MCKFMSAMLFAKEWVCKLQYNFNNHFCYMPTIFFLQFIRNKKIDDSLVYFAVFDATKWPSSKLHHVFGFGAEMM